MLKAIIFDMDGVLIDSSKYIWEAHSSILEEEDIHLSKNEIKHYQGMSLRDQYGIWKKKYGIKKYNLEEFRQKSLNIQQELMKKEKPEPSLVRLLKQAKEKNIRMAVATSSTRYRAKWILKKLKIIDYFENIITADDVEKHKPEPDLFLEAAKNMSIAPKYCVVIEDAQNGVEAAKKANMKVIGLLRKHHARAELGKADLVAESFDELTIERLKKLF